MDVSLLSDERLVVGFDVPEVRGALSHLRRARSTANSADTRVSQRRTGTVGGQSTAQLHNDTGGVGACTSDGPGIAGRRRSDASQGPLRRTPAIVEMIPCSLLSLCYLSVTVENGHFFLKIGPSTLRRRSGQCDFEFTIEFENED
jgi:hypothetical protein